MIRLFFSAFCAPGFRGLTAPIWDERALVFKKHSRIYHKFVRKQTTTRLVYRLYLLQVLQQANIPSCWQHLYRQVRSLEQHMERESRKELKAFCLVEWIPGLTTAQDIP